MKRREQPRPRAEGALPSEFMVGRAVEVWADPDPSKDRLWPNTPPVPVSVMSRYSKAWEEYLHRNGIDHKEGVRLRPSAPIYSVKFLIAEGRRADVEERLARAGAVLSDLPDLRARADEWVAAYRRRVGHP